MLSFYIFLGIYLFFLFIMVVLGYLIQRFRESSYYGDESDHIDVADLTVVIPFRNEEKRISTLLLSLNQLKYVPKEFLFVDDHSDDKTVELIQQASSDLPIRILSLDETKKGKKDAIRYAIENSESKYILTLDADVELNENYFLSLARLSNADMYILPAVMKAHRFWFHLFEVDLVLINGINAGLSGLARPIIASGANLLFSRKAFEKFDRYDSHQHMPSGDDIYLLRDFRKGNAKVRLHTDASLSITTETPQSFNEFIHQRVRWVAKTGNVKDYLSTFLGIIQALLTLAFIAWFIYFLVSGNGEGALAVLFGKTAVDLLAFLPFFNRCRRLSSWLFIPLYEILYPFYLMMILCLMYVLKPEWKGRKLERNF